MAQSPMRREGWQSPGPRQGLRWREVDMSWQVPPHPGRTLSVQAVGGAAGILGCLAGPGGPNTCASPCASSVGLPGTLLHLREARRSPSEGRMTYGGTRRRQGCGPRQEATPAAGQVGFEMLAWIKPRWGTAHLSPKAGSEVVLLI